MNQELELCLRKGQKPLKRFAAAGLAAALLVLPRVAADAQTVGLGVTVSFINPMTLTNDLSLEFGRMIPCASSSLVTVDAFGSRTVSGCAELLGGGTVQAASFTVGGDANANYAMTLPATSSITLGANSMVVDSFTSSPSGTGTLDQFGNDTLTVGATLHVGASQPAGTYTGTFDVTVDYN